MTDSAIVAGRGRQIFSKAPHVAAALIALAALLLLLVPFIVLLYPPFYNFDQPEFIGIPFYYWFQLLWIIITAIITAVLYVLRV